MHFCQTRYLRFSYGRAGKLAFAVGLAYNARAMAKRLQQWWYVPLIWLFFFLALSSLVEDSPTMDEQNHVGRGVAFVHTADPRLSLEHPPLTNALSALPLLTMPDLRLPFDHPSWQRQPPDRYWYDFADQLFWRNGNDVTQMIFLARLPVLFLTLGLALAGYHLARLLWQRPSAPFAFTLLLFDPNVLAHGRLSTTDLGGTLFVLLATLLLWRLWQRGWSLGRWLAAAVGMGLAFGSKLSTLGFVPIWAVVAVLPLFTVNGWRIAGRRLLHFLTAGLASIAVVWAIFGFEWRALRFQSDLLAGLNAFAGPMPTFWAGIEQILLLSGQGRGAAYLLGNFSSDGFVAYFPAAFLVKTPLPTLLALLVAAIVLPAQRHTRRRALFLLLPALLYFAFAMQSSLNIGYRHLLPTLPFVYVLISGLWQASRFTRHGSRITVHASRLALGIAVFGLLVSTLAIHPYYLSYFNAAAGGPENGPRLLLDSNLDWGQDLLRLRDWMVQNQVDSVRLGWFGTADPAYYNIDNQPLPGLPRAEYLSQWSAPPFNTADPEPGIYAISASSLWELPLPGSGVYAWFRQREPDARVGYSIWIYEVKAE